MTGRYSPMTMSTSSAATASTAMCVQQPLSTTCCDLYCDCVYCHVEAPDAGKASSAATASTAMLRPSRCGQGIFCCDCFYCHVFTVHRKQGGAMRAGHLLLRLLLLPRGSLAYSRAIPILST